MEQRYGSGPGPPIDGPVYNIITAGTPKTLAGKRLKPGFGGRLGQKFIRFPEARETVPGIFGGRVGRWLGLERGSAWGVPGGKRAPVAAVGRLCAKP